MYNYFFFIIITIVILDFLFERYLEYLNLKNLKDSLPEVLKAFYDEEKYRQSQKYTRVNSRFSFITSSFSVVLLLAMFVMGGFAWVDEWARMITSHYIAVTLVFFGIIMLASGILNIPFDLYDTFVIEEKFGFNKTTLRTFFTDKLKGWLLGAIIGGGILSLVVWFYQKTGQGFWFYAWMLITGFMIFMTMFYSNLIVPLFNKQAPLEEGELREAIKNFAQKSGFQLDNIFVIDGSKRSTKANAYFTGLGSKKRIVLYDTLIHDMDIPEIVAVLAHEIGHYKKKHTLSSLVFSIAQTGLTLFLFSLFLNNIDLANALGAEQPSFHLSLIAFGILYSPVSFLLGILLNVFSRKNEYQADRFAAERVESLHLIEALKKLSVKNLSNLEPHPLYVFFHYSHPPLLQRIEHLKEINIKY